MKKMILFTVGLLASLALFGQVPVFEWAKQIGGIDGQSGHALTTDMSGNVYVTGRFNSTTDFDPGSDIFNLTSVNDPDGYSTSDIFVAKYDSEGEFLWAVSFGDDDEDYGFSIATDTFNNVYITGIFSGGIDFDPGSGEYYLSGSSDGFILKLNTNGSFVWAGKLDTYLDSEFTIDKAGSLYITGGFNGTIDFDPGPQAYNVTASGNMDLFVLKLDSDGNFLWVKNMESNQYIDGNAIAIESLGNIYLIGEFEGSADFDPGLDEFTLVEVGQTGRDIFILKLDSEGDFVWVRQISSLDADFLSWPYASSIVVDDDMEAVYITGGFDETCDFNPGLEPVNLVSNGENDAFVLKLNKDGDFIWVRSVGGTSSDAGASIKLDNSGNIYLGGTFRDSVDFDPGTGLHYLSTPSQNSTRNSFILKMDSEGNYIWAGAFLSIENNGSTMALDLWGNIYTTGGFRGTADFDPGTSVYSLTTIGGVPVDAFIHKLNQVCNTPLQISSPNNEFTICPSDSILLLAEINAQMGSISYDWSTGDSSDNIVVSPDTSSTYYLSVNYMNNNFQCIHTDSIQVIVFENSDTTYLHYTSCDSLDAGVDTLIYSTSNNCDSIVVAETLFISTPAMPLVPPDLIIQEDEPPFEVTVPQVFNATGYVWTVPMGVQILSGQNTNSIIVDWNGLAISGNICVTAFNDCGNGSIACMEVIVDMMNSTNEHEEKSYRIFPNPTTDYVNVIFKDSKVYEVLALDINGRLINHLKTTSNHLLMPVGGLASGCYWLKIIEEERVYWERVEVIN